MAETKRTEGAELEKYSFYISEDPEAEAAKAWNHKKLKKVITNDYILSYQELLEMKLIFESQAEDAERDLGILLEKVEATKKRIEDHKRKLKDWIDEIAQAEKDIPEIGEIARKEREADEEKRKKHEANLKGEGEGKAFVLNEKGELEDKTGSEA